MSAIVEQMKSEIESLTKERDKFKAAYYSAEKCASDLSKGCVKLQTERDEYRAKYNECYLVLNDVIKERDALTLGIDQWRVDYHELRLECDAERDALEASRYAYATEFSLDEEGQPDVGSIHQNIRALKKAAKLALDALVLLNGDAHLTMMSDEGPVGTYANKVFHKTCLSIESLRKAGVQ